MRKIVAVLALGAGCAGKDTWSSRVEAPYLPPPPPERLLRKPPDFRIYEPVARKEYFLHFYEEEGFREEVVTAINYALPEGERAPRLATLEEHEQAILLFLEDWRSRGEESKYVYFKELHERERRRSLTLLDDRIRLKREEKRQLEDERHQLVSDRRSRKATGTYAEGNGEFRLVSMEALEREIARREAWIAQADAVLAILEHKRKLRDMGDRP